MAKCPACNHDVRTPLFLDLEGWSHLACPNCKARLNLKPRPVAIFFLPVLILLLWLSRRGHSFAVASEILIVLAVIAIVLLIVVRPSVRLKT